MQSNPVKTTFPEGHRLAGRPAWYFGDSRRYVPFVAGGDGPTDPPTPPAPTPPAPPAPAVTDTGVPQERVNALLVTEKEKAEKRTLDKVAETLGVTVEEAKAIIDRQRAADTAHLSDAEKAKAEADKDRAAAAKDKADAANDRHEALIERKLVGAGIDEKVIARAVSMVKADVKVGDDADAIEKAVAALKTDVPALFGVTTTVPTPPNGPNGPKPPSSSPGGSPPKPRSEPDAFNQAFERGRQVARGPRATLQPLNANSGAGA